MIYLLCVKNVNCVMLIINNNTNNKLNYQFSHYSIIKKRTTNLTFISNRLVYVTYNISISSTNSIIRISAQLYILEEVGKAQAYTSVPSGTAIDSCAYSAPK